LSGEPSCLSLPPFPGAPTEPSPLSNPKYFFSPHEIHSAPHLPGLDTGDTLTESNTKKGGAFSSIVAVKEKAWTVLLGVAVLLTIGARYWPYFPGDVAVTRIVQWAAPAPEGWAQLISSTAKFPWNLVLLAFTVGVSWWLAGWRASLLAVASFSGMWVLGKYLGPLIARPRPSPSLVHVVDKLSGYSFPSIFALAYASTIGFLAVLFARKGSGTLRITAMFICFALLLIGWITRIALGAHWPSDVILSYLFGFLWARFLVRFA
jgi:membrane-associated phospholipid phosphatase